MNFIGLIKSLIKRKLENGVSISIDLPSFYTAPKNTKRWSASCTKRGQNDN
jgi:hypothetical protein